MTHKTFYQLAAAEVAAGHVDDALWIKVNVELPNADDKARQAKYITLRAEEMAVESAKHRMRYWAPHSVGTWIAYLIVTFVVAVIAGNVAAAIGDMASTPIPLLIIGVVIVAAVALGIRIGRTG